MIILLPPEKEYRPPVCVFERRSFRCDYAAVPGLFFCSEHQRELDRDAGDLTREKGYGENDCA